VGKGTTITAQSPILFRKLKLNTSQQEVVATLKSCLPIYLKLYQIADYKLTEDDFGCLDKFHQLFEAGLLEDDKILEEAGIGYEVFGLLVGYASTAKSLAGNGNR
jgi:hypothetical protein